jgi:PPM family protein phosphatase
MTLPSIEKPNPLLIRAQANFALGNYQIEVLSYLGLLTAGVHHFQVKIQDLPNIDVPEAQDDVRLGLLRVGSIEGGLSRELELRQTLVGYGLIAPLLGHLQVDSAEINSPLLTVTTEVDEPANSESQESSENIDGLIDPIVTEVSERDRELEDENSIPIDAISLPDEIEDGVGTEEIVSEDRDLEDNLPTATEQADDNAPREDNVAGTSNLEITPMITTSSEYLEEETYPEEEIHTHTAPEKLLLLTDFPKEDLTLENWLQQEHDRAEEIGLVIQLCQLFSHIAKQNWCAIDISPKFIEVGKPLKIFDLSSTYPKDEKLAAGMLGDYCAPELASSPNVNELMSSYTIGALFYQLIHRKLPELDRDFNLEIQPIPRIYQLLKISLSPDPQERFPIGQLLNLLIELRNSLKTKKVQWDVASSSTVGLSTHRLQNEDSYGVRQQQLSNAETFLLGVVADGMGGMAQGDEASKIAVEVLLGSPVPKDFKTVEQRNGWLLELFQQANRSISETIRNGGTTLSAVLAIDSELMLAHVGDSRIYLLRNGQIQQISEDHSLVAMKVANGEITEEESLTDPERNVLLKSLGSKKSLSDGYVQNLTRTIDAPSMTLENGDILLLCSDGVWDLVSKQDFQEIFVGTESLQASVDKTIQLVIDRGASDNSTLLAFKVFTNFY